ncbi:redoxin domain-containing protein [Pseudoalteromonas sp. MMG010]|uniref:redoxin domain-containing protein n=1 Tax=Pseudoalteromonas sp. MMG010 TaxID=2822685 RepID=UPI001B3A0D4D|nr:redoxin domain-containing protein [Pseudoalteromonas sp. MMG010]MBQ4832701.1 redoxin domain-containing protein [Pseudoalteromonas sp. MMG010]
MQNTKLVAGEQFPAINVSNQQGNKVDLVNAASAANTSKEWSLVIIYRGFHCPICLKYLNALNDYNDKLAAMNINLVAVSGDSQEQLKAMQDKGLNVDYPILTELSVAQMQQLGLYISDPMSDSETDHTFAEPGLFLVNPQGKTVMIEIANAPFIRPDIEQLVSGIEFALENDYPIRGTHR